MTEHYFYCFFSLCFFCLQQHLVEIVTTLTRRYKQIIPTNAEKAITSKSKYLYQGKSKPATLKCGAPPCRITYSTQ
jgi:hypothetical protein